MASIEDRIVKIEFDNKGFEKDVHTTLGSLAELDKGLQFDGAKAGISSLSSIASSVENISSKFSALGVIGFTVLQSLTRGVIGFATQVASKLGGDIFGQIISGGTQRAKNIEQAKFMFKGLGLDVEAGMASALAAVKGTAFGLDEAAKAAAQFGASGITVGENMTAALRGVAGAAAMTGSSFTEMADIFAGSAGTGRVTNMDLMQFATRGLNAAAAIGKVLGKTEAQVHEMAKNGTLDFKTFASAMDQAFGAHATEANQTFTGALANMHAAMSRLGAAFIGPELTQQRDLFNAITPVIDNLNTALQPLFLTLQMITGELKLGAIDKLSKLNFDSLKSAMADLVVGLANVWTFIKRIAGIAKEAFKNIFPTGIVTIIDKLAAGFKKFSESLQFGGETALKIKSIFQGIFSVLSIGWTILKETAKFFWSLTLAMAGIFGGDLVNSAVRISDFFTSLQKGLVQGKGIETFFKGLTELFKAPISWIIKLKDAIANLFGGFDPHQAEAIDSVTGRISDRFENLRKIVDKVKDIWQPFANFMQKVGEILSKTWDIISGFFSNLGSKIADALSSGDFSNILDALNTGIFAVLTGAIIHWFRNGFNLKVGLSGGFFDNIAQTFDQLTGVLKSLQVQIKAEALKKIAIAIAILTASVLVLSLIDSAALTKALTAMAVGFGQLMGAFAILNKLTLNPKAALSFALLSVGMIVLGAAILVLAVAAKQMAKLNWGELAKGLIGTAGLLLILVAASKLLSTQTGGMIRAGIGIAALSVGLLLMASAVKIFATMSWSELSKGLLGLAGGLLLIVAAMLLMPPHMALLGLGLVGVSIGLIGMATALKMFGNMSWGEIGRGLVALAGGLLLIAAAMYVMPDGMITIGLGLIAVGFGLGMFARALKVMGSMSWEEIARGLTALAGSLIILAVGVTAMSGAVGGAIALVIISGGLLILAGVLKLMGKLNWGDLLEGLGKLAVVLGGIALVALLLEPAIPALLGLALALGLLGLAFLAFGAGAMLVAKAFEIIGKSGEAAAKSLGSIFESLGKALPAFARGLAEGLLETVQVFADGIGKLVPAFAKIIGGLLTAIQQNLPMVFTIFNQLLDGLSNLIYEHGPQYIELGFFMLTTLLQGIVDNIDQITTSVVEIITGFINSLAKPENVQMILGAGLGLLVALLQGLVNNISLVAGAVTAIITRFITELGKNALMIIEAGTRTIIAFITGLKDNALLLADAAFTVLTQFLNGLADIIRKRSQELKDAGKNLASAIIDGLVGGWGDNIKKFWHKLEDFGGAVKDKFAEIFDFGSPSKVTRQYGEWIAEGFAIGMDQDKSAEIAAADLMNRTAKAFEDSLVQVSSYLETVDEFNPKITPVLDLTKIAADASLIDGYIQTTQKLTPNASLNQARVIASTASEVQQGNTGNTPGDTSGVVFNQTINAPTQLATADIYKQTRNQITIAKEELAIP